MLFQLQVYMKPAFIFIKFNLPLSWLTASFYQAHGRPTLKNLVEAWNKMLQKEIEHTRTTKTDATAAFLASLEDPKLPSLGDTDRKPPIEILPPGMSSLSLSISAPKKPLPAPKASQQEPGKPLLLGAPPTTAPINGATPPPASSGDSSVPPPVDSSQPGAPATEDSSQPEAAPSTESAQPEAPPPDSSQAGEESAETGAPSSEISEQPKPEESPTVNSTQVDSSEAETSKPDDSSQPDAPPPVNSNQPETLPPTVDIPQPTVDPKTAEQQLLESIGPVVAKPSSSRSPFADLEQLLM